MGAGEGMARARASQAKDFAPSFEGQVEQLEKLRQEGNRLFAERNWTLAVCRYCQCIDLACILPDPNAVHSAAAVSDQKDEFNRVVVLAFSNRAEARLRLQDYAEALVDAECALQIDSKHVKTLVRKGKALHALELYQKACEAFQCALVAASPEEQPSVRSSLKASNVSVEQSRNGHYDLADFFGRDCQGPIPPCADFIGPVEIRRKPTLNGRNRGLFATKSLEPGELLIVSNPLAAGRQQLKSGAFEVTWTGFPDKLVTELVARIRSSNLQSARFCYLASDSIPTMDLFRSGSECIPPCAELEGILPDAEYIHNVASRNMFHYMEMKRGISEVAGLWLLPAFAKHSCAPNCQHSLVGETLFFRASRHIKEVEELSILYFSGAYDYVTYRRSCSRNWMFKCKCERCVYEEKLLPQLSRIHEGMQDPQRRHAEAVRDIQNDAVDSLGREELKLSSKCDQVEAVIKSLGTNISTEQKKWIRASFLPLYLAKMVVPGLFSIDLLRMVLEASVDVSHKVLETSAWLLAIVREGYSKDSKAYRDTLDQVRVIYSMYYGKLPDALLHTLIKLNTP